MTSPERTDGRRRGYEHMGAVICDAGLQAALNYRTVIAPRIDRLLRHWPCASTTSAFGRKTARYGLTDILRWHDATKLHRIRAITALLLDHGVEDHRDAQQWLTTTSAEMLLLDIHGVGQKTVDYLRLLVGVPELVIDRHVRAFATRAGATGNDRTIKRQILLAASHCGYSPDDVDRMVWHGATGKIGDTDSFRLSELHRALDDSAHLSA
jgi:hypothetical protein